MYFCLKLTVTLLICIAPLNLFADHNSDVIDEIYLVCTNGDELVPSQTFIEIENNQILNHSGYVNHIYRYELNVFDTEVNWSHKLKTSSYGLRLNDTTLNRSTLKKVTKFTSLWNGKKETREGLCGTDIVKGEVVQRCEGTLQEQCQLKNQQQFLILLNEKRRPHLEEEQEKIKKLNRKF